MVPEEEEVPSPRPLQRAAAAPPPPDQPVSIRPLGSWGEGGRASEGRSERILRNGDSIAPPLPSLCAELTHVPLFRSQGKAVGGGGGGGGGGEDEKKKKRGQTLQLLRAWLVAARSSLPPFVCYRK